ncbi:hypothetical protein LTR99_007337 [Exophiala xenobiotica]|uniref:Uncharacterized protein n=1 Tax=Vermiconidia calcicola TaxID=1690605 RepID=A0AAV9Q624_9PEZI|nr:hypothetical protein LTR92_002657 [Exophiala xenobiotica]KAK5534446.1 hypothetical protein LTR25_006478 [Vermiconidia calcicola]KAK5536105.1 hypothetical protein LTR23_008126 [Chaetothyriales sp. CCFEE 6169]KAK5266725.1 hypothetical protein LTR96_007975 [Exophiala xenobiotica]KAK5299069.1 hypothetical protein LTR99_007337 [Exophiala xenobiotica]
MAYALLEGVTIAWWHTALKEGTNVGDLHRMWEFGHGFLSAVLSGRHFNLVALASILVALSPINGPLLQRASTLANATVTAQQEFELQINPLVPRGYTGIVTSRAEAVNMLTTNFSVVARDYYIRSPIPLRSECIGSCRANVLGAGFHTNCSSYLVPFNISESDDPQSALVFGANIVYSVYYNPIRAVLNVQYKPEAGCIGNLTVTNCTLQAGTVRYPIVIDGAASTVTLDPSTTIWDDVVIGNPDFLLDESSGTVTTTYGGIFLAIGNQYNTDLSMQFGGAVGYEFFGAQSEASIAYARGIETGPSCDVYFTDPLADFLQGIRELIFRTAIATANSSNTQHIEAQASGSHTIYHTDFLFLALATVASLLAIAAILLTFHGFWGIGRNVSMSPIETAKAFNAPLLRNSDSNAPAKALLKEVGTRPVRYGIVSDTSRGEETTMLSDGTLYRDSPSTNNAPDHAHSPNVLRRYSTYRNPSGSDFELLTAPENLRAATIRLELADPKRVTPL